MAKLRATVRNSRGVNDVTLQSNQQARSLDIPPKAGGFGSSASGGELLFLALATCYCNDIYREAAQRGITVERVEVEVEGEFGGEGEPASNITYRALVKAAASPDAVTELMRHTDQVAEIHNTLRTITPVLMLEPEVMD